MLGNKRHLAKILRFKLPRIETDDPTHNQLTFLIRSFFFVFVGLLASFGQIEYVVFGILTTVAVYIGKVDHHQDYSDKKILKAGQGGDNLDDSKRAGRGGACHISNNVGPAQRRRIPADHIFYHPVFNSHHNHGAGQIQAHTAAGAYGGRVCGVEVNGYGVYYLPRLNQIAVFLNWELSQGWIWQARTENRTTRYSQD